MKFQCPKCKKIFNRDMRLEINKDGFNGKYYKSYCEESFTIAKCKPLK